MRNPTPTVNKIDYRIFSIVGALLYAAASAFSCFSETHDPKDALFPEGTQSLIKSHFTWGAAVGSSIDLSGYDTSTFDVDVMFGFKNRLIQIAGVGAGVQRSFGNGNNFIPVYAIFQSSFRKKPSLCFLHLKAGYSFNTVGDATTYGDVASSIGLGFNLARKKSFRSYFIIAYGFRHFTKRHKTNMNLDAENISLAQIGFGINF